MFSDITINLAPFVNFLIYTMLYIILVALYRKGLRKYFGRKIANAIRLNVLRILSEHHRLHDHNELSLLVEKLQLLNKEMKVKYKLLSTPLDWNYDDLRAYNRFDRIDECAYISRIRVRKKILMYKMVVKHFDSYSRGDEYRICYSDCIIDSREAVIDSLIG